MNELSEKFPYFHPLELYEAYVVFSNRLYTTSSTFQHLHDVDFTTLTTLLSNSRPRITITRIESTIVFKDNRFLGFDGIEEVFPASRFKSINTMTRGTSSCVYESVYHAMNAQPVNGPLSYRRDFCRFIEDISEETSLASQVLGPNEREHIGDEVVLKEMYKISTGSDTLRLTGDIDTIKKQVLKGYVEYSMKSTSPGDTYVLHYLAQRFNLLIRVLERDRRNDNNKYILLQNVCSDSFNAQNCPILYLRYTRNVDRNRRIREHFNCLVPILRDIGTLTSDTRRFQTINDGNRNMRRRL